MLSERETTMTRTPHASRPIASRRSFWSCAEAEFLNIDRTARTVSEGEVREVEGTYRRGREG
jgi:hypothetical protein